MKAIFKKYIIILGLFILSTAHAQVKFDKVVIWGHKLHTDTFSYVWEAFYKAFKQLGYETYWFDDSDNTRGFNFNNCLFITMGEFVNRKMPINDTSYYMLHNCDRRRYEQVYATNHAIAFQVYTDRCVNQHDDLIEISPCIYKSKSGKILYMPWATDLLPHEIEQVQKKVKNNWGKPKERVVYWIGTMGGGEFGNIDQIEPFRRACYKKNLKFKHLTGISPEENRNLTLNSYLAPTIVGAWQKKEGYIPCRIFKTASNGQFGITNSQAVYNLFERKIVYNPNTEQLFYDAYKKLKELTLEEMLGLMDFVKNKHTYLNRVAVLLDFLNECA